MISRRAVYQISHIANPQVSFARDITPLFRDVDISHMTRHGIKLDDYTFMSDPVDQWPNPMWACNGYPTAIAGINTQPHVDRSATFSVHVLLSHFALDDVDLGIRLGLERFNICNAIRAQLASPQFPPSPLSEPTTARAGNLTGTLTQPVFNESARC
jgi:hypothetical protein